MARPAILAALTLGVCWSAGLAAATDRWVAPGGDDAGAGTRAAPWRTLAAAADRARPGDTVWLTDGTWRERLRITRSGTASAPIRFAAAPGASPVIDGAGLALGKDLEGVVDVRNAEWIEVAGLRVTNAGPDEGAAGIYAGHCDHVTIRGCATAHTASSGIGIWWSRHVLVDGNDVADACHGGSQECVSIAGCDGFEVRNNVVHDGVSPDHGGEGIDAKHGANGRVHHNRVHHIVRLGIYVDAWDTHTHDIEVDHNLVHDVKANGYAVAAEDGGLLERIRVHDNVAARNAHVGITVAGWGEPVPHHPIRDVVIEHNTFVDNGTSGWGGGLQLDNPEADGIVVRANLLAGNRSWTIRVDHAGRNPAIAGNLAADFRGEKGETLGDRSSRVAPTYRVAPDGSVTVDPPPVGDAPGARGPIGPQNQ